MLPATFPVTLPEMPHLADHAISGRAIVPAVEILNFLLHFLGEKAVALAEPLTMRDAVFPRFLSAEDIPRCRFDVTLEDAPATAGAVRIALISRIALPNGIERQRTHAAITFGGPPVTMSAPPVEAGVDCQVTAERVYRELIPFGPHFCNLTGSVRLGREGAWAAVRSPSPGHPSPSKAGCPYLFDSAMHLACVWGQRYAGLVAYPTGFSSRTVFSPTMQGRRHCVVKVRRAEPSRDGEAGLSGPASHPAAPSGLRPSPSPASPERARPSEASVVEGGGEGPRVWKPSQGFHTNGLLAQLWLIDDDHRVCDTTEGLAMAPVAAGAPPPAWIVSGPSHEVQP
jgi:hypothetical protein